MFGIYLWHSFKGELAIAQKNACVLGRSVHNWMCLSPIWLWFPRNVMDLHKCHQIWPYYILLHWLKFYMVWVSIHVPCMRSCCIGMRTLYSSTFSHAESFVLSFFFFYKMQCRMENPPISFSLWRIKKGLGLCHIHQRTRQLSSFNTSKFAFNAYKIWLQ